MSTVVKYRGIDTQKRLITNTYSGKNCALNIYRYVSRIFGDNYSKKLVCHNKSINYDTHKKCNTCNFIIVNDNYVELYHKIKMTFNKYSHESSFIHINLAD